MKEYRNLTRPELEAELSAVRAEYDALKAKGLKLTYLAYQPIQYPQLWGDFAPCMSVLDYIFNCGFDWQYVEEQVEQGRFL